AVAKRASVGAPPGLAGAPPPPAIPPSRKRSEPRAPSPTKPAAIPPAHVSADMLQRARAAAAPTPTTTRLEEEEDRVALFEPAPRVSRSLLDVLAWRAPALAVGWMLFAGCLALALLSRNWS